ncbi:TVG0702334 [Thermoplasma volcanium GSS1]|uniref:TVG0702334 protein n=1 Tax=Thermoplasma volcanium (strain ATCC 51530 / DSM 4299 / JCM 9571 / NBRC 15438 / GSS1) TaxID=273116 RepID=Q97AW4_THEVO|nr:hypothetical protein [Thermoplasma volcanium]BAB59837.1 TVG0702334 [Thermoplasma volcanium GSS1]
MNLKDLGNFRIERTEDYSETEDKSYTEMIRVKGSKPELPYFKIPSHLYKYYETELALYLKDHKNYWRPLGKLLGEEIDITDEEIVLVFPVKMFSKVAEIVPFVRKRGQGNLKDDQKIKRLSRLKNTDNYPSKIEQKEPKYDLTELSRSIAPISTTHAHSALHDRLNEGDQNSGRDTAVPSACDGTDDP